MKVEGVRMEEDGGGREENQDSFGLYEAKRSKIDSQNKTMNIQASSVCTQTQQPVNEVRENQQ